MTTEQLEQRVTVIEKNVADLRAELSRVLPANKGILSVAGSMKDFPEFADVIAAGRYFRVTGRLPPDDWNPGDPIPEPDEAQPR
jgi:hypothetical protein